MHNQSDVNFKHQTNKLFIFEEEKTPIKSKFKSNRCASLQSCDETISKNVHKHDYLTGGASACSYYFPARKNGNVLEG